MTTWTVQYRADGGAFGPPLHVDAQSVDDARDAYIMEVWPDIWSAHHNHYAVEQESLPQYLEVWGHIEVRPRLTLVRGGRG